MFSKACEYGIRATIYVAKQTQEGKKVGLKDIAKEIGSPEAFTAKTMQILTKNLIIDSTRGPNGGFEIPESRLHKIKLYHIVKAIDGESLLQKCGLGFKGCDPAHPCPLHNQYKDIKQQIKGMLENTNLAMLAEGFEDGKTYLFPKVGG